MVRMLPPWKGQQWEYEMLVLYPDRDPEAIEGALDPIHHLPEIRSHGFDGWEVISVQLGRQRIPSAPGETRDVIVVLMKRPRLKA